MLSSASTRHLTNRDCNRFGGSMTRQTKGVEARRLALSFTMAKNDKLILACLSSGRLVTDLDKGDVVAAWSTRARGRPARTLRSGYKAVMVRNNGDITPVKCSRVICIAAYGMPPTDRHEVNHKNGIKTDDRSCNLEWVTPNDNLRHAYRAGLRRPRRRFNDDQVLSIKMMRSSGMTWCDVAAHFGCSDRSARGALKFLKGESDE